jgi:hypothetical protein
MYRNQVRIASWSEDYIEKELLQHVKFWHCKCSSVMRNHVSATQGKIEAENSYQHESIAH